MPVPPGSCPRVGAPWAHYSTPPRGQPVDRRWKC